jgi:hypothetical protein
VKKSVKRPPRKLEKTYSRCVDLGEAIEKASCHLGVVMEVVINEKVERGDPFPWRNLSGTLQGLHEMKKKAPELGEKISRVRKDTESLRGLIYRTPGAKERIHRKYNDVLHGIMELRKESREICSDPVSQNS